MSVVEADGLLLRYPEVSAKSCCIHWWRALGIWRCTMDQHHGIRCSVKRSDRCMDEAGVKRRVACFVAGKAESVGDSAGSLVCTIVLTVLQRYNTFVREGCMLAMLGIIVATIIK